MADMSLPNWVHLLPNEVFPQKSEAANILDLKLVGQDFPLQHLQKYFKASIAKCDCISNFTLLANKYTKNKLLLITLIKGKIRQ